MVSELMKSCDSPIPVYQLETLGSDRLPFLTSETTFVSSKNIKARCPEGTLAV